MKWVVDTTMDSGKKSATLPFIGKCLKTMGMEARKEGDAFYVDLNDDSSMVIGYRRGRLSVAVVKTASWDDVEKMLFFASITMATTDLTKIFLLPEGEELNIWFSAENFCKTRGEFEGVFKALFKQLMVSVRKYADLRECFTEEMRSRSLMSFMMNQAENQQPS